MVLSLSTPPRLSAVLRKAAQDAGSDALADATHEQRNRQLRRLVALRDYRAALGRGLDRVAAADAAATMHGVSRATLYRWAAQARQALPQTAEQPRCGAPQRIWAAAGVEQAWRLYRADYLRPEQPASRACYRRVCAVAQVNGWHIPSEKSFLRRLRSEVSPAAQVQAREGNLGLLATVPHQERSVSDLEPLEWVCGDGRRHDLFVLPPEGTGKPLRPVVWYWQDVYSRRILAWRCGLEESADLVRLATVDLCTQHGVPQHMLIDNTRAAAAMWLSGGSVNRQRWRSSQEDVPGILQLLGIAVHHTGVERDLGGRAVGRGWAKPVERSFRDLAETIDRHPRAAGAYTGRSTLHKPENYQCRALPWREFVALVDECVAAHNAQPGRRTEAADGESFDDAWRAAIGQVAVRRLADSQRALLLLACETTKVRRDGTLGLAAGRGAGVGRNRYHHEALLQRVGQCLVARFDPQDLHAGVHVYDLSGRWLCHAECLLPVGFASTTAAKAHVRAHRQRRRAVRAELAAQGNMEALLARRTVRPAAQTAPSPPEEQDDEGGKIIRLIPSQIAHPPGKYGGNSAHDTDDAAAEAQSQLRARLNRGRQKLRSAEESCL